MTMPTIKIKSNIILQIKAVLLDNRMPPNLLLPFMHSYVIEISMNDVDYYERLISYVQAGRDALQVVVEV